MFPAVSLRFFPKKKKKTARNSCFPGCFTLCFGFHDAVSGMETYFVSGGSLHLVCTNFASKAQFLPLFFPAPWHANSHPFLGFGRGFPALFFWTPPKKLHKRYQTRSDSLFFFRSEYITAKSHDRTRTVKLTRLFQGQTFLKRIPQNNLSL